MDLFIWKAITFLCSHWSLRDVVSSLCDVVLSLCCVVSPLRGGDYHYVMWFCHYVILFRHNVISSLRVVVFS